MRKVTIRFLFSMRTSFLWATPTIALIMPFRQIRIEWKIFFTQSMLITVKQINRILKITQVFMISANSGKRNIQSLPCAGDGRWKNKALSKYISDRDDYAHATGQGNISIDALSQNIRTITKHRKRCTKFLKDQQKTSMFSIYLVTVRWSILML